MTTKPEPVSDGYVRFWIEHDTEVAMLTASDFRAAMSERNELRAEVERLEAHRRWANREIERLRAIVLAAQAVADEALATNAPGQWDDYRKPPTKLMAALIKLLDGPKR